MQNTSIFALKSFIVKFYTAENTFLAKENSNSIFQTGLHLCKFVLVSCQELKQSDFSHPCNHIKIKFLLMNHPWTSLILPILKVTISRLHISLHQQLHLDLYEHTTLDGCAVLEGAVREIF